jgi:hypothetical protein
MYQGGFDLSTREWKPIPRPTGGSAGTGFGTQSGVSAAISNGRIYHVERNFLRCRGW